MSWWKSADKSELACSAILVALGVSILADAWDWPYLTKDGPGPGFFPLWIGISIIGLSVAVAALHLYDVVRRSPVERPNWRGSARVLTGWAGLAVSIALMKPAGFILSFLLLVVFLVMVIFQRSFLAALTVGAGTSIGFWVVFVKLLQVQLPAGPWGF
ncbi:MAG: tripartite tricarboxylate transporter TctB family protein [Betaproteobacteria bacterium]|nr:tripartite tricarboxylate transporter TctB family protein [Betaproteobacteria bacterium]